MKRKLIAAALAISVCMSASLAAVPALAAETDDVAVPLLVEPSDENDAPAVRVTIEDTTFLKQDGSPWDGVLCDEWVNIDDNSSMLTVLGEVIERNGFTQTGLDVGYITEVNGLSASMGGDMGCFLLTLNNWMTDEGADAYTVSSGKLCSGDEIKLLYSTMYGMDIGCDFGSTSTQLNSVSFSEGKLTEEFSPDKHDYVLELPKGANTVKVSCEQVNKVYRARVFDSRPETFAENSDYKPSQPISVSDDDLIIIICGDQSWSSYPNESVIPSMYTFRITHKGKTASSDNALSEVLDLAAYSPQQCAVLVRAARARYNSLTPEQAAEITNLDKLIIAEKALQNENKSRYNTDNQLNAEQMLSLYTAETQSFVYGSEWALINYARCASVSDEIKKTYTNSLKAVLDETKSSKLSASRSTTNSLVVLALTSIGVDPHDFFGYDLLSPLSDLSYIKNQGINGPVYALLALDSHNYDVPAASDGVTQTTREALIAAILEEQQPDGGWTIDTWTQNKEGSDADMTAMVLQSFAPYYKKNEAVTAAVDKAILFLISNQDENGMFVSYGSADCESCAQVLTALCALDIEIIPDERFSKSCNNPFTALRIFYIIGEQKFSHVPEGEANDFSTTQGYQGVVAMWRHENKSNGSMTEYFDMTDVEIAPMKADAQPEPESKPEKQSSPESTPLPVPSDNFNTGDSTSAAASVVFAALSAAAMLVFRRRKQR